MKEEPPPDPGPSTGLLVIAGPIADAPADIARLCERLRAVMTGSDAGLVTCDVAALPANARALEALARLQLTARRHGRGIRLQRASPALTELIELAGLAEVLPRRRVATTPASPARRRARTAGRCRGTS